MKRTILFALNTFVLLVSGGVYAHAMLENSYPANAAVLEVAPKELKLEFGHPTKLAKVKLLQLGANHKEIPITLNLSAPASTTFSIPLPALEASQYQVKWGTLSKDGHAMTGMFSFTVTGK